MKESYEEELAKLNQAIELNPTSAQAYFSRGFFYENNNEYELALADLTKVIELYPYYSTAYFNRAMVYLGDDNYKLALADLNQSIELESEPTDIIGRKQNYRYRAVIHEHYFNYGLAISDYSKAIELDLDDPRFFNARALLIKKLFDNDNVLSWHGYSELLKPKGKYQRNLLAIRELVDIDDFQLARLNREIESGVDDEYVNFCRSEIERKKLALEDYSEAIRLNPNGMESYVCRARLQTNNELALADYSKAIELGANDVSIHLERASLHEEFNNYDLALADYEKIISLEPKESRKHKINACISKLKIYIHLGDYDKALMDCNRAIEFNLSRNIISKAITSITIELYYYKALIYSKQANLNQALAICDEMLELIPNDENDQYIDNYHLAIDLAIQQEDYAKAKEYNNKYFSNASNKEKKHEEVYSKHLNNSEELELKNRQLQEKITELELEKQQKETVYKQLHEKEKEMLSFFTHTMRNALATAPESLRQAIRLLGSNDYESNQKNYEAINEITALFSTLSLTDCLIDTFKQSIYDTEEFTRAWEKDNTGEATPHWFIAAALRQSLNRILFMSDATDLRKLLNNHPERIKPTRKSFIEQILPLDINTQGIESFYSWLNSLDTIELSIADTPIHFGMNQIKFSLLFSITSELILNALKYWSGKEQIKISWGIEQEHYVFRVQNGCLKNASSNLASTHKGLAFIKRLINLLGEQAYFEVIAKDNLFEAELKLHQTLLENAS